MSDDTKISPELSARFNALCLRTHGHTNIKALTDIEVEALLKQARHGLAGVEGDNFSSLMGELDPESLALHHAAEAIIGSRVYSEETYAAAVQQAQREQERESEPDEDALEGFDLDSHLAVADAVSRIALDRLDRVHSEADYLAALRETAEQTGLTNLDSYDR